MDGLFQQIANLSKAHAYDIVSEQRNELVEENEKLKNMLRRAKIQLESLRCSYKPSQLGYLDTTAIMKEIEEILKPKLFKP